MKFFNRVRVLTPTTGTGDTITLGSPFSVAFFTLAEVGGAENDETAVCVEQGNDAAIYHVTVGASAATIAITSVKKSRIGGTAGTSRINLDGTAVVRFIESAEALNDILSRIASLEGTVALLGDAAFKDTGTASDTVAAGDDSRITGAAQKASNGSDFADPTTTRSNLYAAPFDALASNGSEVNGRVDVSQELGTTGATLANNANKYTADCWEAMYNHGAATAVVTSGQVALSGGTAIPGFAFGHQIKATTALSSLANGDFARHRQQIEGWRVAHYDWGTANACSAAIFAKMYSVAAGTIMLRVSNAAGNRAYHREVAISAGLNTIREVIPGDTSGTWEKTTSAGMIVDFFVAGKAASPATPDAWGTTPAVQSTNSTNLLGTNNNLTIVTGFKVLPVVSALELPSSDRAALIMRPFNQEEDACKKYWEALGRTASNTTFAPGYARLTTLFSAWLVFHPKRTSAWSGSRVGTLGIECGGTDTTDTGSPTFYPGLVDRGRVNVPCAGLTQGQGGALNSQASLSNYIVISDRL